MATKTSAQGVVSRQYTGLNIICTVLQFLGLIIIMRYIGQAMPITMMLVVAVCGLAAIVKGFIPKEGLLAHPLVKTLYFLGSNAGYALMILMLQRAYASLTP